MSWSVSLDEDGSPVGVESHTEGGTYVVGGTTAAELNVTYNYSDLYHEAVGHNLIGWLDGKRASQTIQVLQSAVDRLGVCPSKDYWEMTAGNAGYAAKILLGWAKANPDAVWSVL